MEPFRIDEIARRLLDSVPPAFRSVQRDLESNFRAVLRSSLGKLDLVSREEFETQARVLERTRARLEALEARVVVMEGSGAGAGGIGSAGPAATGQGADAVAASAGHGVGGVSGSGSPGVATGPSSGAFGAAASGTPKATASDPNAAGKGLPADEPPKQ